MNRLKLERVLKVTLPHYSTSGAAGIDFYIPNTFTTLMLPPGASIRIPSGIVADIPDGKALLFVNRSGLGMKGLTFICPLIDSDFVGEIALTLRNDGFDKITLKGGDKVAQAVLIDAPQALIVEGKVEKQTDRGSGGFGSTDKK